MTDDSFAAFEAAARAQGYDEMLERSWPANAVLDTHTHAFAVNARVVRGRMWLTVGEATRELASGDTFTLAAGVPHAERYGPDGAAYWVARRNPPKAAG